MSVKGIVILNQGADGYRTQLVIKNTDRYNARAEERDIDKFGREQKKVTEETLERIKESAEKAAEKAEGIDYALYARDEDKKAAVATQSSGVVLNPSLSRIKAPGRVSSPAECHTCANRKYQDGSDESDVSFQTPMAIAPSIAASVILGHEHEHVANAYERVEEANAHYEAGGAISHYTHIDHVNTERVHSHKRHAVLDNVSVRLKTDICPECGRVYFSGGVTNTSISYVDEESAYSPTPYEIFAERYRGERGDNVDIDS